MPLLAATRSDSSTIAGSADPAAGLKKTVPTDRPNATPSTMLRCWCERASRVTRPALQDRRHHDAHPGQPVEECTGNRGQQEHGQDLRDDDRADAETGPGQVICQQGQRDCVDDVAALGNCPAAHSRR